MCCAAMAARRALDTMQPREVDVYPPVKAATIIMGLFQSTTADHDPKQLVESKIALRDTVVVFSKSY